MPKFHNSLYYKEKKEGIVYSDIPSGMFDVDEAMKGPRHWIADDLSDQEPLKKTLVIDDWCINTYSEAERKLHKENIAALIAAGFTVYITDSESKFTKLHAHNIDIIENDRNFSRSTEETISYSTNILRLKKEHIAVIDDLNILNFSSENSHVYKNTFDLTYTATLDDEDKMRVVALYYANKEIVISTFSYKTIKLLEFLQTQDAFKQLQIKRDYQHLDLTYGIFIQLENQKVTVKCGKETLSNFNNIQSVHFAFGHNDNFNELLAVLKQCVNLEKLKISKNSHSVLVAQIELNTIIENIPLGMSSLIIEDVTNEFVNAIANNGHKKLHTLEALEINEITSLEQLAEILVHMPNLKKLTVKVAYNFKLDMMQIGNINLPQLIEFNCSNNKTLASLKYLFLKNKPELKKLHITPPTNENESLEQILAERPQTETLMLMPRGADPTLNNASMIDVPTIFPKIKALSTDGKYYTLDKLAKLFPNLIELTIYDTAESKHGIPSALDNLKTLTIFASFGQPFESLNLEALLKISPKLEALNVNFSLIEEGTLNKIIELSQKFPDIIITFDKAIYRSGEKVDAPIEKYGNDEKEKLERQFNHFVFTNNNTAENNDKVPAHNPFQYLLHQPIDTEFEFSGATGFHQKVIMDRINQYITIFQNNDLELVPKIQQGICFGLSNLFASLGLEKFNHLVATIEQWNGKKEPDKKTLAALLAVLDVIKQYQIKQDNFQYNFIGDNLLAFLKANKPPFIFQNPWHAISVTKENGLWVIYDPNFTSGAQKVESIEAAVALINTSIGHILFTPQLEMKAIPNILNIEKFFAAGGLVLLSNSRIKNINEIIKKINTNQEYLNTASLEGLLLRSTSGRPAWLYGLESNNKEVWKITTAQLQAFISQNPLNYNRLNTSINVLDEQEKLKAFALLSTIKPNPTSQIPANYVATMAAASADDTRQKGYETQLRQKSEMKRNYVSPMQYAEQLISKEGDIKKKLVKLDTNKKVYALASSLERYCNASGRKVFYVDIPSQLNINARYIEKLPNTNQGRIHTGFGGELYDFLKSIKATDPDPVIIINYANFSAEDIVNFNAILDKNRNINNYALPNNLQIVGLINNKDANCYQGSDFYSRFDKQQVCPLKTTQLDLESVFIREKSANQEPFIIDLYHSADWKYKLTGHWQLKGDEFVFAPGVLKTALESGKPIEIRNGFWQNEQFQDFWRHAKTDGYVMIAGEKIPVPANLQLIKKDGYDHQNWPTLAKFNQGLNTDAPYVLNPRRIGQFFRNYQIDTAKQTLDTSDGIIANNKGKTIEVNLTRELTIDDWAKILDECKKYDVKLNINCANSKLLPENFKFTDKVNPPLAAKMHTQVVQSNDPDCTINNFCSKNKNWQVIDVTGCSSADLLERITPNFNDQTNKFTFTKNDCALIQALNDNKNTILTGEFSQELKDSLAPVLLQRMRADVTTGQVMVISNNKENFDFLPTKAENVTLTDKKQALLNLNHDQNDIDRLDDKLIAEHSFTHLVAHLENSNDPWLGMTKIKVEVNLKPFSPQTSSKDAESFLKNRYDDLETGLTNKPFVFVSGLTGTGKSTTIEDFAKAFHKYYKEDDIAKWIADKSTGKKKILFLDEANIGENNLSMFEGLYRKPPTILYKGQLYELDEAHKVIFAGNPLNYSKDRQLSPLLARHGNAILFEPLSMAFIFEKVLKPVLEDKDAAAMAQVIFAAYQFVCAHAVNEVLMTPRELEMIALLTKNYLMAHANDKTPADPIEVTKFYTHQITKPLIKPELLAEFEKIVKPQPELARALPPDALKTDFVITPSRNPLMNQLNDLIALSEIKRTNKQSSLGKYTGLGGIIIEGEPGIGKSELVSNALRLQGYKNSNDPTLQATDKVYHVIPVSWSLAEKKAKLLEAFHKGDIVVVEEINSSPMMERFLNNLLSPTKENKANNPGFMLIGTQNPMTMAGRRAMSPALARRLIKTELTEYSDKEMKDILLSKKIPAEIIDPLIRAYRKVRAENPNDPDKQPCFRDLEKLAEKLKAHPPATFAPPVAPNATPQPTTEVAPVAKPATPKKKSNLFGNMSNFFKSTPKKAPAAPAADPMQAEVERYTQLLQQMQKQDKSLKSIPVNDKPDSPRGLKK